MSSVLTVARGLGEDGCMGVSAIDVVLVMISALIIIGFCSCATSRLGSCSTDSTAAGAFTELGSSAPCSLGVFSTGSCFMTNGFLCLLNGAGFFGGASFSSVICTSASSGCLTTAKYFLFHSSRSHSIL